MNEQENTDEQHDRKPSTRTSTYDYQWNRFISWYHGSEWDIGMPVLPGAVVEYLRIRAYAGPGPQPSG